MKINVRGKLVAAIMTSLVLSACSGNNSSSTDKYLGTWKGDSALIGTFNISKEGDTYNFNLDKTNQVLSYCYSAKKVGEKLVCNSGVVVEYDAKDDTLHLDFGARKDTLTRVK